MLVPSNLIETTFTVKISRIGLWKIVGHNEVFIKGQ